MVKYIKGDLLETDADIILHQVNLQGVMGGGLALAIARRYPNVEQAYMKYEPKKLGTVVYVRADKFFIGNCFSQNADFTTNYNALKRCLNGVLEFMREFEIKTVAIPYKYGCGIANGDWNIVESIFKEKFKNYDLLIYQL